MVAGSGSVMLYTNAVFYLNIRNVTVASQSHDQDSRRQTELLTPYTNVHNNNNNNNNNKYRIQMIILHYEFKLQTVY